HRGGGRVHLGERGAARSRRGSDRGAAPARRGGARADVEGEEERVRRRRPDQPELLRPGRRHPALGDREGPPRDRRDRGVRRAARRQRLPRGRRESPSACPLRRQGARAGRGGGESRRRHPEDVRPLRRLDHRRARRRVGQGGVHGRHVFRRRPGHDGARALRLRPGVAVQPREGLPDAEALRRPARPLPRAPGGAVGGGVAGMTATGGSASPTDSILGVAPRTVYRPASVEDAVETVRACAVRNESLAFVGGGTDLELGAPPEKLDAILRTTAIDRLVEHAPSDQIAVVEAGMTLAAFQSAVGAHRQRLALDPALPERRTIGGILAANAFGPRRARFGSVRDLLIGISFVRADGTPARGGGKVVKNVAGFDLPKLMVGSLGTLGLITTATFRLHPLPEEEATLLLPARSGSDVRALASGIKDAQLEPSSVVAARRAGGAYDVAVPLQGLRAGVEEQRDRLAASLRGGSASCEILDDPAAGRFWGAHDELRSVPPLRGKLAALPSHIEVLAAEVLPGLAAAI